MGIARPAKTLPSCESVSSFAKNSPPLALCLDLISLGYHLILHGLSTHLHEVLTPNAKRHWLQAQEVQIRSMSYPFDLLQSSCVYLHKHSSSQRPSCLNYLLLLYSGTTPLMCGMNNNKDWYWHRHCPALVIATKIINHKEDWFCGASWTKHNSFNCLMVSRATTVSFWISSSSY